MNDELEKSDDYLAFHLYVWIIGASDLEEFEQITGRNAIESWNNLELWERDEYRFAAERLEVLAIAKYKEKQKCTHENATAETMECPDCFQDFS